MSRHSVNSMLQSTAMISRIVAVLFSAILFACTLSAIYSPRGTDHKESTESVKQAVDQATGKALQGDTTSALKILLDVPASAFSSEEAEWRACMIRRFGASGKAATPAIDDRWVAE